MDPLLKPHLTYAAFLSKALPAAFGMVLFDLTAKGMPAVFEQGVSGAARDAARSVIKKAVKNTVIMKNGMLINRSEALGKEKLRKLSVLFIKDEADKAIGALAIVTELSGILSVSGLFSSLLEFEKDDIDDIALMEEPQETRPFGIEGIKPFILKETADPKRTTPEEKTELIMDLYDMGVFSIKGSVMETASILGMSEQSVYRYIAKIKRFRGE